ncbi:hypothetical protein DPMN_106085 [Dreissena polymorpha]|uniref:Uncharacterized protein n=1 Tax=Dreissena polymorpha TaxID=45954 RepID=A0A9D4K4D2_DREPO|nr:hypothetical protein DPMN_106085 [Dreissena polymorpha]
MDGTARTVNSSSEHGPDIVTCFPTSTNTDYTCKNCASGWKGKSCHLVDCSSGSYCTNDGECVENGTDYTCVCKNGWNGKDCELVVCTWSGHCNDRGSCVPIPTTRAATALPGGKEKVAILLTVAVENTAPTMGFVWKVERTTRVCARMAGPEKIVNSSSVLGPDTVTTVECVHQHLLQPTTCATIACQGGKGKVVISLSVTGQDTATAVERVIQRPRLWITRAAIAIMVGKGKVAISLTATVECIAKMAVKGLPAHCPIRCLNDGECHLQNGGLEFNCTCAKGYLGDNCQIDMCSPYMIADIVMVIDISDSQTNMVFQELKENIKQLISQFPVGPNHFQFSIILYGKQPHVMFHLNNTYDNDTILDAVDNMTIPDTIRGPTFTGEALQFVYKESFRESNGGRSEVDRYVLVITDGMASDIQKTLEQAKRLSDFLLFPTIKY